MIFPFGDRIIVRLVKHGETGLSTIEETEKEKKMRTGIIERVAYRRACECSCSNEKIVRREVVIGDKIIFMCSENDKLTVTGEDDLYIVDEANILAMIPEPAD